MSGTRGKANFSKEVMGSPLGLSSRKSFPLTWPATGTAKHAEDARGRRKERRQKANRNTLLSFSLSFPTPSTKVVAGAG